jgi:hypothetical protein
MLPDQEYSNRSNYKTFPRRAHPTQAAQASPRGRSIDSELTVSMWETSVTLPPTVFTAYMHILPLDMDWTYWPNCNE